jgi:hypothetical protein
MLQINPFLDCTLYSRIVVHIAQNNQIDLKLRADVQIQVVESTIKYSITYLKIILTRYR